MSRINFYQVFTNRLSLNKHQATELVRSLTTQSSSFLTPTERREIFSQRGFAGSAASGLYHHAVVGGALDNTQLLYLSGDAARGVAPELAYRHLCLDMRQLADAYPELGVALRVNPQLNNQMILNVTQMLRKDQDLYMIKDAEGLRQTVVRDLLSRSYWNSRNAPSWLEAEILHTSAHCYAALISSVLSRGFDASVETQQYMQTVFTLYFLSMVQTSGIALSTVRGKSRRFYLPFGQDMELILKRIEDVLGKEVPETLDEAVNAINGLGIDRVQVNRRVLFTTLRSIGPDVLTSSIALEYPPYFVWCLLLATGGKMAYLGSFLKKQRLDKDIKAMGELLSRSHLFLPEVMA